MNFESSMRRECGLVHMRMIVRFVFVREEGDTTRRRRRLQTTESDPRPATTLHERTHAHMNVCICYITLIPTRIL